METEVGEGIAEQGNLVCTKLQSWKVRLAVVRGDAGEVRTRTQSTSDTRLDGVTLAPPVLRLSGEDWDPDWF